MFTQNERAYLKSQRLARIATVSPEMQPDVAAVSYEFDGAHFYVGGRTFAHTLKYKNVRAGNTRVALIVDDLDPATRGPRGLKIHGRAELVERAGHFGEGQYFRLTPERSWSWGIEQPAFVEGRPVFHRNIFD